MFRFGNASLALIVPKKWVDRKGLGPSSLINISENSSGDLVVSSREELKKEKEEVIEPGTSTDALGRLIGLHYMFGTTKLRLYFKGGIGKDRVGSVSNIIKEECPGFEVISHSADDMVIEDFNNLKEADLWKIIHRLRLIVKQEFKEIRDADAKALQDSERLVNRFYMLGVRHLNMLGTDESTKYFVILQMLEMISDNLNMLGSACSGKGSRVLDRLEEQFDMCFSGLDGRREAIEKAIALRSSIYNSADSLKLNGLAIHAIRETTNEISRISEFGLYLNRSNGLQRQDAAPP